MADATQLEREDWTEVGKMAVALATAAGLGYLIFKAYRDSTNSKKDDNTWASKLDEVKEIAKITKTEIKQSVKDSLQTIEDNIHQAVSEWTEDMKKRMFSEDTIEAFDTIQKLVENVSQFDMNGKEYNGNIFLLLALVKKIQNLSDFQTWEASLPDKSDISGEQVSRGKRFGQFALRTYQASREADIQKVADKMGVEQEDVLHTTFKDEGDGLCPRFIVFADNESMSIILAIRGTFSLKDVIIDMVCEESPYLDGFTHQGILTGARRVWEEACESVISALNVHSGYNLVVTGHSLGAGVAVLITLELLLGESTAALPAGTEVRCIALAPPPVYRASQSIFSNSLPTSVSEKIEIYIHHHDCIPRMSLGSLTRLLISMRAVDNLALTVTQQINILRDITDEGTKDLLAKVVDAVKRSKQDEFPFLQHPGKIFYLKKEKGDAPGYVVLQEESKVFTNRLYLLEDMVTDHRGPSYQEALNLL